MLDIPAIPETAPFTAEQRLWLNGFLAGYYSRGIGASAGASPRRSAELSVPLRILFGSQTGTALSLAKRIAKEAVARGFIPKVSDAADHATIDWATENNLLVVTSTYGDGDMPDNAQGFWDWLKTDVAAPLAHLRFTVLALGDRNYTDFCGAGRKIDGRLEQLGAHRVFPRADCDLDYESTVRSWMDGALGALYERGGEPARNGNSIRLAANGSDHDPVNGQEMAKIPFSRTHPFRARLMRNVLLSRPGSGKEVRHFELGLQDSGLAYNPGDALGVLPVNCPDLVQEILSAVRCNGEERVRIEDIDMPLREAFATYLDLSKPSSELLKLVAERTGLRELTGLLSTGRRDELRQWLWGRGVIDLLGLLPEPVRCDELAWVLNKLVPRLYSISSSLKAHPDEVHVTVNIVRYEAHGRSRKGVASTFLADRVGDAAYARVYLQPSHGFNLPRDKGASLIMVGPGTGIAPFRAFLEERQACGIKARHWLFFGDQKRETDFLYEEQFTAWVASGHLTRLDLAFSRDQSEKIYVQHRMLEQAAELWAWLQDGAYFYVCGDASRMAKDVDAALHRIAEIAGGKGAEEAKAWVAQLKCEKRYQRDVY